MKLADAAVLYGLKPAIEVAAIDILRSHMHNFMHTHPHSGPYDIMWLTCQFPQNEVFTPLFTLLTQYGGAQRSFYTDSARKQAVDGVAMPGLLVSLEGVGGARYDTLTRRVSTGEPQLYVSRASFFGDCWVHVDLHIPMQVLLERIAACLGPV